MIDTSQNSAAKLRRYYYKRLFREQIEQELERYLITENFDSLFPRLKSLVQGKARSYAKKCLSKGLRIYEDDFESVFWEIALDLANDTSYRNVFFFDALSNRLESRAKNIIRDACADKRKALTFATTLTENKERKIQRSSNYRATKTGRRPLIHLDGFNPTENQAIANIIVEQMAQDESLTDEERRLFQLMHQNPDASLQELADELGTYKQKVKRMISRLRSKLGKYYFEEEM
ncbi:hypothetical protein CV632_01275 [Geobacillus thermodenitrificans]|uniref:winged helix-turn-helix transcriptional regulator n=1 Tax=Geobacillus thermodenitrificans TaxID=33940 RepID=UPI000C283C28|nr:winged helix-turn-helix transcriptional regulator [Geobacillus thermodenitrificans]PJW21984.1 hypothetical protein CV632_01275 [Geobacillus thermodenitrificans]